MAEINAQLVGKVREKTGARLMDAKKALVETQNESSKGEAAWLEAAETWLRKVTGDRGSEQAKKAATEGLLGHKVSADGRAITVVEMTANTDFVAKNEQYVKLLNDLVEMSHKDKITSVETLNAKQIGGKPVSEVVTSLAGTIGENIGVKRVIHMEGDVGFYIHFDNKQGAVVELSGVTGEKATALGKDISMHIVFAKPNFLVREEVPAEAVAKETAIIADKLKDDPKNAKKPPEILQKIAAGQLNKFYGEVVLPDQAYYRDGAKTVAQILKDNGATVKKFVRFQVGAI
jgi:elongation factor Ts